MRLRHLIVAHASPSHHRAEGLPGGPRPVGDRGGILRRGLAGSVGLARIAAHARPLTHCAPDPRGDAAPLFLRRWRGRTLRVLGSSGSARCMRPSRRTAGWTSTPSCTSTRATRASGHPSPASRARSRAAVQPCSREIPVTVTRSWANTYGGYVAAAGMP